MTISTAKEKLRKDVADAKASAEEAAEKARLLTERVERIESDLPNTELELTTLSDITCYAQVRLVYKAETLQEALELAEKYNPVSIFKSKGGCCAFVPEYLKNEPKYERDTQTLAGPWIYSVSRCAGIDFLHDQQQKLELYTVINDVQVEVEIEVAYDPDTRIQWDQKCGSKRRTPMGVINDSGHFTHVTVYSRVDDYGLNSYVLY